MTSSKALQLPLARVKKMHAEYAKDGNANITAKRHRIYAKTLLEVFRSRGLEIFNRKSQPVDKKHEKKVRTMHAYYMTGATFKEVGDKFGGHSNGAVRNMFTSRNLFLRSGNPGCYVPDPPKTDAEIEAMIAGATRIVVPAPLAHEWRHWSMERRGWLLRRLREKLNLPNEMPRTGFSSNVEPFDYTSPRAWELVNKMNEGLGSRDWKIKMNLTSQGVIWKEELFFWTSNYPQAGGGYYKGPWRPETGRPQLHHVIWEELHGPVPASHCVRFRDGNYNNFHPDNLYLQSRADEARENKHKARVQHSRNTTALLLQRFSRKQKHEHHTPDQLVGHLVTARDGRRRARASKAGPARSRPDALVQRN